MKNLSLFASSLYFFRFLLAKNLASAVCITGIFILHTHAAWSQANAELSNLVSPTKVNVTLLPSIDNTNNLGSISKSWKDFYLDGYLYIDGARFISNSGGSGNVFVGDQAGNISMTGAYNSAFGDNTLVSNTTGNYNSAFGNNALNDNTAGDYNAAFGRSALAQNTVGYYNSAFGYTALEANTTGTYNTAFGAFALEDNTIGVHNSAFGDNALGDNTTGFYNSALGSGALSNNTTGNYNSALGNGALSFNTTGSYNAAFGYDALTTNTTGAENAAFGREALSDNTVGTKNVAVGNQAGFSNTSGNYGTFLGFDAGGNNTTGSQNTYLGYSTEGSSSTYTNVVGIGYQVTNTASSQARIGNSSTISIGGYASWTNISDGRFKKNVKEEVAGLDFINKLRPVTYNLDLHAADEFIGKEFTGDHETDASAKISEQAKSEKEKIIYTGFIAQEVESAAKEIGYDFSGIDAPKNERDLYGLRYAEFVVPLVKAVQELNEEIEQLANVQLDNEQLKSQIESQQKQIDELRNLVNTLVANQSSSSSQLTLSEEKSASSITLEGARLEQNIPNPFDGTTIIQCFIPETFSYAQLIITSSNGVTLRKTDLMQSGSHKIRLDAQAMSAGNYNYSLIIDGKVIDTKQMILMR